ncbi:MAG: flagellar export protein FliJ [Negativicutes bacterium]|nr:flagellar export protein FliJ [Negativicutes bacterium]
MQTFHFRLDALLKFRRMQEEEAQIKLAQSTAAFLREKERLDSFQQNLSLHLDTIRNQQKQPVTVATLKMLHDYHDKIKKDIVGQQLLVTEAATRRREDLAVLEQAIKAHKLVKKLREKRFLQYQTEMLHEEQKSLDELGLQVFARQK